MLGAIMSRETSVCGVEGSIDYLTFIDVWLPGLALPPSIKSCDFLFCRSPTSTIKTCLVKVLCTWNLSAYCLRQTFRRINLAKRVIFKLSSSKTDCDLPRRF